MVKILGSYNEDIILECYTSYVATLRGSFDRQARLVKLDPLTQVLVWGSCVDIFPTTIRRFLYSVPTDITFDPLNLEFY